MSGKRNQITLPAPASGRFSGSARRASTTVVWLPVSQSAWSKPNLDSVNPILGREAESGEAYFGVISSQLSQHKQKGVSQISFWNWRFQSTVACMCLGLAKWVWQDGFSFFSDSPMQAAQPHICIQTWVQEQLQTAFCFLTKITSFMFQLNQQKRSGLWRKELQSYAQNAFVYWCDVKGSLHSWSEIVSKLCDR